MWSDEKHIIDFNDIPFIDAVKWCVGVDYGTANPTTFQLMFKAYDGKIYIVNEYYHSGGRLKTEDENDADSVVGYEEQKTDLEYANDLKGFLMDNRPFTSLNWNNIDIIVDPAAASFVLQLRKLHFKVKHANNSVIDGIRTVSTYIGNDQFFVSNKCTNFIGEIHNYSWDDKAQAKGLDAPCKESDHCCLTGDTLVHTIDGYKSIQSLVGSEGYLHTIEPSTGELCIRRFFDVRKTGTNRRVFRVWLEDGNYVDATEDHPFLTDDGWKSVEEINVGDNIVSPLDT